MSLKANFKIFVYTLPMVFNLLSLAQCAADSYNEIFTTLKHKIAKLHTVTKYATFYEFFNVNENCSDSEIKKAFRRLKKATAPNGMKKDQFDELVMYGYSLLVNYRKAYDGFLRDSKFLYINEPVNYKNYAVVIVIALIFFLIFIDFVTYGLRFLKYLEAKDTAAKKDDDINSKNVEKKNKKHVIDEPPSMISSRLYKSVTDLLHRKN